MVGGLELGKPEGDCQEALSGNRNFTQALKQDPSLLGKFEALLDECVITFA